MTPEQSRFLALHAHRNVVQWQWFMQDTQLRATTDNGYAATLSRLGAEQLVAWGFMTCGTGHSKEVTDAGRAAILEAACATD